jgi:trigger factor
LAKARLEQQFRMYSPQGIDEEQLSQYAVQYLQNKENANKIFEDVKAFRVFDYIKSVVTLEQKEILYTDFTKQFAQ